MDLNPSFAPRRTPFEVTADGNPSVGLSQSDRHPWPSLPREKAQRDHALDEMASTLRKASSLHLQLPMLRACIRDIGDEILILERLGPELVYKFFSLLEGKRTKRPYFFPAGMAREHLGVYLDWEINHQDEEYQRQCVLEFLKDPLLAGHTAEERKRDFELGCNLAISLLRAAPLSFARLMVTLPRGEMQYFLSCVDRLASVEVRKIFAHLFDGARLRLIDRYACSQLRDKRQAATTALKKLRKLDVRFFHTLRGQGRGRAASVFVRPLTT